MASTVVDYQGRPTLSIETGQNWQFSFGLAKAALILENISDILAYVEEYDEDQKYEEEIGKFRDQIAQIHEDEPLDSD